MDRLYLFGTPILVVDVPDPEGKNAELAAHLLAESAASPGVSRSNVGGWHSVPDLAQRPDPRCRAVMQTIVDHLGVALAELAAASGIPSVPAFRYGLHAWAMVMRDGDYAIAHDHGDAHWSSAYYLDAGDADAEAHPMSGQIAFVDPKRGGRPIAGLDLFPSTFTIKPRTGMMLLFPGFVQHYVHTYRGARPRVSVSCNITVERRA